MTVEFAKEIAFNKNNKEFEFTAENNSTLFIYVIFSGSNTLPYKSYKNGNLEITGKIFNPGKGIIFKIIKDNVYKLVLELPDENDKGKIWINPSYKKKTLI